MQKGFELISKGSFIDRQVIWGKALVYRIETAVIRVPGGVLNTWLTTDVISVKDSDDAEEYLKRIEEAERLREECEAGILRQLGVDVDDVDSYTVSHTVGEIFTVVTMYRI